MPPSRLDLAQQTRPRHCKTASACDLPSATKVLASSARTSAVIWGFGSDSSNTWGVVRWRLNFRSNSLNFPSKLIEPTAACGQVSWNEPWTPYWSQQATGARLGWPRKSRFGSRPPCSSPQDQSRE